MNRRQLTTFDKVRKRKPPAWRIDNLIPQQGFVLVTSAPAVGKTLMSVGMTHAAVTGQEWCGRTVKASKPLWIVGEDIGGLGARSAAWEAEYAPTGLPRMAIFDGAIQLADEDEVNELVDLIEEREFDWIIFETLARCIVGLDENSAKDMGPVMAAVERITQLNGGTTVVAHHHTTKDDMTYRGSSAMAGAADTMLSLRKSGDGTRSLYCTKQKNGPYDDGKAIETFRIKPAGGSAVFTQGTASDGPKLSLEDRIMTVLSNEAQSAKAINAACDRDPLLVSSMIKKLTKLHKDGLIERTGSKGRYGWKRL